MKFVHIADMHFDSPFVNLSDKGIMGDLRRLEQRKVFKKIIEFIKENKIKYFFIIVSISSSPVLSSCDGILTGFSTTII